jgi:hypothetical protein
MTENPDETAENTIHNPALERAATLAAWQTIETDPEQQARIAAELAAAQKQAAQEEAARRSEQEAKDKAASEKKAAAEKAAKAEQKAQQIKTKEDAEAQAKAAVDAEHAAWENEMFERIKQRDQEQQRRAPEQVLERTLEIPEHIRANPHYQQALADQRALQARLVNAQAEWIAEGEQANRFHGSTSPARIEAAETKEEKRSQEPQHEARQDPYEQAAQALDAKPLEEGQGIEGEVLAVEKNAGNHYYIVEQDGERVAVPAGEKPEYSAGDEISAERTKNGFEIGEAYGYGR